jgi:glucose/arabinose dehydrogenase
MLARVVTISAVAMALAVLSTAAARGQSPSLAAEPVAQGLTAPIQLVELPDGSGRKLIVQQDGIVRNLGKGGELAPEFFLDLRSKLVALDQSGLEERGLLGFALHPAFARNGRVLVTYSAPLRPGAPQSWNHTRRVSEFTATLGETPAADPRSERVLLELDWPSRKHNGGGLAFGPDGFLYIGLGDSGASHGFGPKVIWEAFDVPAHALAWDHLAQDRHSLFGKILRIDVDRGFPGYAIPPTNPFAGGGGRPEVWTWGWRNPFRITFDSNGSGDLYVTAVAETLWEAVYRVRGAGNFGWPLMEGVHCVDRLKPREPPAACADRDAEGTRLELPVVEYPNMQASHPATKLGIKGMGTAVTGARVYRGRGIPALAGKLVVADWSADFRKPSGQIFMAEPKEAAPTVWPLEKLVQLETRIIGLEADRDGELYLLTNDTLGPYGMTGQVLRLVEKR